MIRFTKKEKELLANELADRFKDVVYMNAQRRAKELIRHIEHDASENESMYSQFNVECKFTLVWGDILQIIGRSRRTKKKRWLTFRLKR